MPWLLSSRPLAMTQDKDQRSAAGDTGAASEMSTDETVSFTISDWHSGKYWSKYPPNLPPEYYQAIGEICQRWAWLEFQCGVLAREVLRLDKKAGYAVTGGMSMRSISTVLEALSLGNYLDRYPELKARLNALAVKLSSIGEFRNEYAHGIWGYEKQGDSCLGLWKFKKPEDRMEPNWVHKPLNALLDAATTLRGLQETAQQLTRDLKGALRGK